MNFCPNCGTKLTDKKIDDSKVKLCHLCGYIDWNNWVNVSCVVAAYTNKNECVMVKLKGKEQGKITFPGGYRNLGETLEQAAKREFYEETGMDVYQLELFKVYTKDEQRLVWIVYKGSIDSVDFTENEEVSELLLIKNMKDIDHDNIRGTLTKRLLDDLNFDE